MSNIRVAMIEDDPAVRGAIAGWLQPPGFTWVGQYGSAEEAIKALPEAGPEMVLTDINLPGMTGVECVRRLKPQLPNTQFVMLTVYEDANHIFDALVAGATGYLLKQVRREELISALQDVHAGGSPMTGSIARKVVQAFQRPNEVDSLWPREREVLDLLARGYIYKEIAEALGISVTTVNTHIRRIYEKLHVQSRSQAVAKYAQIPILSSNSLKRPA